MFDSVSVRDSLAMAFLKRAILISLAVFLFIGMISSHRAYYQVRSLELYAERTLQTGSTIQTTVVSSGRTYADVEIELIQRARSETLATQLVPANEHGFFDPRTQQASLTVVLTPETMARFESGPALLRATARGRSQWTRVPPPVVREIAVDIKRE